ncbi:MAG: hypothetical protein E7168_00580 [Firmicutes bacterium]|nr:hypothetical protein [Bacillota bacterium]
MEYTKEEILDFINHEYDFLELTENDKKRYLQFIEKTHRYITMQKHVKDADQFEYFNRKFNEVYETFLQLGRTSEQSLNYAKKLVLCSDRKDLIHKINFSIVTNFEEQAIMQELFFFKRSLENAHARKMHLIKLGDRDAQKTLQNLKSSDKVFEKKFQVSISKLQEKYPITDELLLVWGYQARLTDEQLKEQFGITREEMSYIYPTTKEELEVVKTIGKMDNKKAIALFGLPKEEILKKYPLTKDTLIALKTIAKASDTSVQSTMGDTKENILKLRTITTEMIRIARDKKRIELKKYTRQELSESFKTLKKGTQQ